MSDQKNREIIYDPRLCFFGNSLPKPRSQSDPMSAWVAPKNREDDRENFEGVYGNDRETLKNLKTAISSLSRFARQYLNIHETHSRNASDRLFNLRKQLFNALYAQEKFFAETCLNILIQVYTVHNEGEFWQTLPNNKPELRNIHREISETLNKIRESALRGVLNSVDKAVPGWVTERFPWELRDEKPNIGPSSELNETYVSHNTEGPG